MYLNTMMASISTVTVHLHYLERSVKPIAAPICKVNIEKLSTNVYHANRDGETISSCSHRSSIRSTERRRKKNKIQPIRGNNFTILTYIPRSMGEKFANSACLSVVNKS